MVKKQSVYRRLLAAALLLCLLFSTLPVFAAENITQNWSAAAVYYDAPCYETESFLMSEEEFLLKKAALEKELALRYEALFSRLSGPAKEACLQAQEDWSKFYKAYLSALEQRWTVPVKLYYGKPNECRTIVYRDNCLRALAIRIDDLRAWEKGWVVQMSSARAKDYAPLVEEERTALQVNMGLCLYVIDEPYRPKITVAHNAFFAFLDSNAKFIALLGGDTSVPGETMWQLTRMHRMTKDFYQGCRFYRREREE